MRIFARRCLGANASRQLEKNHLVLSKVRAIRSMLWDDDWNTRAEILNREHRGGRYPE